MSKDRYTLDFELRYAVRLLDRQIAVYRAARTINTAATLILGSGALYGVAQSNPAVAAFTALVATFSAATAFACGWADKIAESKADKAWYARLYSERHTFTDAELEQQRDALCEGDVPEIPWLHRITYNDVADELGCEPQYRDPLSAWQRLVRAVV